MAKAAIGPTPQFIWALRLLRYGLAFVFVYAAISAFVTPQAWLGFIPSYVPTKFAEPSLDFFGVIQLGLALWLISGQFVRLAAITSALIIAALTFSNLASLVVTFRDIGLALAAVALALLAD